MNGLHLTADWRDCACDLAQLYDAPTLLAFFRQQVQAVGLTQVGETHHVFSDEAGEPAGVTGVLLLAESHIAFHTWPESRGLTLDIYVCNFSADHGTAARQLLQACRAWFQPTVEQCHTLTRGSMQID